MDEGLKLIWGPGPPPWWQSCFICGVDKFCVCAKLPGMEVSGMRLLDRIICVHCAKVSFKRTAGKSSRTFMGECEPSCEKEIVNVAAKDVSPGKPAVVSEGNPRKG